MLIKKYRPKSDTKGVEFLSGKVFFISESGIRYTHNNNLYVTILKIHLHYLRFIMLNKYYVHIILSIFFITQINISYCVKREIKLSFEDNKNSIEHEEIIETKDEDKIVQLTYKGFRKTQDYDCWCSLPSEDCAPRFYNVSGGCKTPIFYTDFTETVKKIIIKHSKKPLSLLLEFKPITGKNTVNFTSCIATSDDTIEYGDTPEEMGEIEWEDNVRYKNRAIYKAIQDKKTGIEVIDILNFFKSIEYVTVDNDSNNCTLSFRGYMICSFDPSYFIDGDKFSDYQMESLLKALNKIKDMYINEIALRKKLGL